MKKFKYCERRSNIFGRVDRPLVTVRVFSKTKGVWIAFYETLADTGADISIIPKYLGKLIVGDITLGRQIQISGIVPYSELVAYIHNLRIQVAGKEFEAPVAVADSDRTIAILGRVKGLNLFNIEFQKGKTVCFKD